MFLEVTPEITVATGAGVKFHLANIAGSPTTTVSGSTTALNSLTNKDETLKVYGYVGDATISYATGATSKDISEAITAQSSTTGVTAYAETNVRLTVTPDSNTSSSTIISFKLTGMNTTAKVVSSTVNFGTIDGKTMADLSDLRDKINGFTGDTGIQAKLSADKQTLDLRSPDGYDILIDDYDMPMETATNIPPGATGNVKAAAEADDEKLTFASAHGLTNGDAVRVIQSSAPAISGTAAGTASNLLTGQVYYFKDISPISTTIGQLMDADGNVLAFDADGVDLEFEKITKSLNVQTLDRDLAAKGAPVHLHDDTLAAGESPGTRSSMRVSGQIIYQSPNVFTITTPSTLSTSSKALHRDAAPAASLTRISDVNVKTVMGAQRLLSAVDGALRRVDAERGDLGATMNRMEHTIDNLSNIVVNTKISRSRMQDADMAAESIELTKGRILQQAATSMLSQANQSMQSVLELLQ
jgi:flagellin